MTPLVHPLLPALEILISGPALAPALAQAERPLLEDCGAWEAGDGVASSPKAVLELLPERFAEADEESAVLAEEFSESAEDDGTAGLLAAVRRGSDEAARALVEKLYPLVIRIIRPHLPVRGEEEDIAQEVFLKMFSRLSQYRGESPFTHWVSRIATNTCLDLLRRKKSRPEIRFSDLSVSEEFLLQAVAEETWEETPHQPGESAEVVEKLLASLKPEQRLVVRLLDVERHSVHEICDRTGWSASKVKMTALRARRKLAKLLSHLGRSFFH